MKSTRVTIAAFERTRVTLRPRAPQGVHMSTPRVIRPFADRGLRATARDLAIGLFVGFALLPALASTRLTERPAAETDGARLERLVEMRDVLAREVYFAPENGGPADARRSAESVEAFVRARSGLTLDGVASRRLADLEARTERGELRRLTPDDLAARLAGDDPPLVLDVRTRSAYAHDGAHIPGDVRVLPVEVGEWASTQPRERPIVAYCT
jgi:hypothetical protein